MERILILDDDRRFLSDVEAQAFLDGFADIDTTDSLDEAFRKSDGGGCDRVAVSGSFLDIIEADSFHVPAAVYAADAEDVREAGRKHIPCLGIVRDPMALFKALKGAAGAPDDDDEPEFYDEEDDDVAETADGRNPGPRAPRPWENGILPEGGTEAGPAGNPPGRRKAPVTREADTAPAREGAEYRERGRYSGEPYSGRGGGTGAAYGSRRQEYGEDGGYRGDARGGGPATGRQPGGMRERIAEEHRRAAEEERIRAAGRAGADEEAVMRDMGNVKDPARVVTVYSAKGGVGKTTISCELATFLALSAHGRGRLKVCLADFNVDFGDVLNTLSLDAKQPGIANWAADIRERLGNLPGDHSGGYSDRELGSIRYSADEMDYYLQKIPESGLYVLIAPVTNEDSMDLSEGGEEIKVILNSLVHGSDFDYIICDTGNNTRNSSFIPLEMADDIIMVMTQSVNTANCNSGFISTAHTVGFDTRRIKTVINKARPAKSVGVQVGELQEVMVDPMTGRPFECIAVIKDSNDVRAAENRGRPVVYDPNNQFTKSIAAIAKSVNREAFTLEKPEKKRRMPFLKRKG